jgi:hypothetical protein
MPCLKSSEGQFSPVIWVGMAISALLSGGGGTQGGRGCQYRAGLIGENPVADPMGVRGGGEAGPDEFAGSIDGRRIAIPLKGVGLSCIGSR